MSRISLSGNASGTGTLTIAAPNTNTDRTLTLPDNTGTILTNATTAGFPAGSLVAFQSVTKTDTFSASVAAGGNTAVTGLSITHALKNASNKLLITANIGVAAHGAGRGAIGIAIHNGTGLISIATSPGSRTAVTSGGSLAEASDNDRIVVMPSLSIVTEPGSTSSITYTVHAINIDNITETLYINRSESDADSNFIPRGVSTLQIQEIAA